MAQYPQFYQPPPSPPPQMRFQAPPSPPPQMRFVQTEPGNPQLVFGPPGQPQAYSPPVQAAVAVPGQYAQPGGYCYHPGYAQNQAAPVGLTPEEFAAYFKIKKSKHVWWDTLGLCTKPKTDA